MCKFVCRLLRVDSYFFIDTFKYRTQQKYEKKINRRRNYRKSNNCFGVFFGTFFYGLIKHLYIVNT